MKKSSIKVAIAATLFAAVVLPASAVDFGGTLDNTTKFTGPKIDTLSLDQKDSISFWLRAPFNNEGTMYLAAEGLFQYEYIQSTTTTNLVADCDLFKFSDNISMGAKKSLLLSVGRFFKSDSSGIVFSQTSDGVYAQFKIPKMNIGVYGGYTGLLNAKSVSILNAATSTYAYDTTKVYAFAAPYAVAGASFTAPYLFANQTIGVEVYSFFGTASTTSNYNRFYGTLSMNGPLSSNIFYTFASTFGTDDTFASVGNLSQFALSFYPTFMSSAVTAHAVYASGRNGPFSAFTGFTSNSATLAMDCPEYTGIITAGLSYSMKPLNSLLLSAGADGVFDCPESVSYSGVQFYGTVLYQAFTDVQLSLSAQQYIDTNDVTNKTSLTAKAVISF